MYFLRTLVRLRGYIRIVYLLLHVSHRGNVMGVIALMVCLFVLKLLDCLVIPDIPKLVRRGTGWRRKGGDSSLVFSLRSMPQSSPVMHSSALMVHR